MKYVKNHLSFLLPIFILLFSYQFSEILDKSVADYQQRVLKSYSIIVVSNKALTLEELKKVDENIDTIKQIDRTKYIKQNSILKNMPQETLAYLLSDLPEFYSITLSKLPSQEDLINLKNKLLFIPGVVKVKIFQKSFQKLEQFLILTKGISYIFTIFIFIISVLLILKQMEIWTYEHQNRMYVMGLFGAPYWLKSAPLYRLVIIDSFIASLLVSITYLYLPYIANLEKIKEDLGVELRYFNFFEDTAMLLFLSLSISIIAVTFMIIKMEKSQ